MVINYIGKAACVVLLIGFASGVAGQVELMTPGIAFMRPSLWTGILTLHMWATPISLAVICLSTISLIRDRTTFGQWAVWLGFCAVPLLFGALISLVLANAQSSQSLLGDTVYLTANRHAFGTAALLVALGGLSALQKVKSKNVSLRMSFGFALLITSSGVAMVFLQTLLGMQAMPRRYIDYPQAFAQFQFYASFAAIACFSFSAIYVILLWRCSDEKAGKIEEVF